MQRIVEPKIQLSIGARTFDLVWDDDQQDFLVCNRCALQDVVCRNVKWGNLVALCGDLPEQPNTWFVETTNSKNQ